MPRSRTQAPLTTGSSVLGLQYRDGVIIAADNLASYGTLARFMNVPRLVRVNNETVIGCTGDFADFQYLSKMIEEKQTTEDSWNDGHKLSPKSLYTWLTRVQYNRRSKIDPLWCTWVVGGLHEGTPFLGQVDKLGMAFSSPVVCTGYGGHMATPLIREVIETRDTTTLSFEEARALLEKCLTVLSCRDGRTCNKYHLGIVDSSGSRVEGPFTVAPDWAVGHNPDETLIETLSA